MPVFLRPLSAKALLLVGLVACSGDAPPAPLLVTPPIPKVVRVVVIVDSTLMTRGSSSSARALALDSRGFEVLGTTATWQADSSGILSVSATGVVTGVQSGTGRVYATVDGIQGEAAVSILGLPVVALVDVALSRLLFTVGDTSTGSATARDSLGAFILNRPVTWSIESDSLVATVSNAGLMRAVGPGNARLVAVIDSIRGEYEFSVAARPSTGGTVSAVIVALASLTLRIGDTASASARAYDSLGVEILQRSVTWSLAGNPAVASISTAGKLTAIAAGSATVQATIDGVRGQLGFTVVDTASGGGPIANLPALPETLSFAYPKVTGKQWLLKAGDNLQTTLNQAQRGDEIVLPAGVTFTGNFVLPAKPGGLSAGWILIRSDKSSQLPPQGTRVSAAHAPLMPKIVTANVVAVLATDLFASGWWISGVEFSVAPAVTAVQNGMVELGIGGQPQNELAEVPTDLVLDRVFIHGLPTTASSRCLELHSARTMVSDSYLGDCHGKGFDSQAIVGWNGPGPYKIVNNTLSGAGENVMFGGADPAVPNLVPSDIEFRYNYVYTPASWKTTWTKKNLLETKNARRMLIEGNVFDGSWSDGQVGYAILLKSANQSGRCTWCVSRDITIRYNIIRNAGSGFNLTGREGSNPYPVGELLNHILIEHNVLESINVGPYAGDGNFYQVLNNVGDLIIRNNTSTTTGSQKNVLTLGNKPAATNFDFSQNVYTLGRYGIHTNSTSSGEVAFQVVLGQVTFTRNVVVGAFKAGYPSATFVPSLTSAQGSGMGANQAKVNLLTANVVVP